MDSQWRNFSLVFTLAAAVVTPAFGQAVAPTVGPAGSEEESASSIPDFSGIWVHSIPGFEPLPSGPTALVNRSRRENGTGDILKLAGDYTNPILKPEAAEVVKGHGELGLNGIGDPNPRIQCWPGGGASLVRQAKTLPSSTFKSIFVTSAIRRSRRDLAAVSTARLAASSHETVLTPITSTIL
jgi:hypothetical protein